MKRKNAKILHTKTNAIWKWKRKQKLFNPKTNWKSKLTRNKYAKICYKWNDIRVTMMNGRKTNIEITMKSRVNIHIISVMSNLNRLLQNTIFLLRFLFFFIFFCILYSFIFWQTKNVAQHGFFYQERIFIYIIYINAHKLIETMHVHTDNNKKTKQQQ